ncbi:MAG TPA: hypothetical protein PK402_10765, partial [Tepidisphaeraceae bacterium]|nr:hypothetical protein [Tepidisphaeraceae bacterium]
FDQDVLGSIEPTDLVVENLSNGSFMSISELFYDSTTNKAAFVFSAGHLPDGRYRATLDNLAIRNSHADAMANDYSFDFHVLAGDANRDETVNFNDLLIVAQNYGQEDRRFSQGNVNYSLDGKVDFNDLLIIAQNYGVSVVQTASTRPTPFNYSHRIGEDVLSSDIGVRQASIRTCRFSQLAMPSDLVL